MLGPEITFADPDHIIYEDNKLLYLAGTDYHRMSGNPNVLSATSEGIKKYGISPTGSRATTGNHSIHIKLEKKVADFFASESAVVLPSGYLSNIVLLQTIGCDFDVLFLDECAHPSLVDAAYQVSKQYDSKVCRFRHSDAQHLESQVKNNVHGKSRPLVMTDGVFPMFGNIPPLGDYIHIVNNFNGKILIDDAHGMTVVGKSGKGSWEETGVDRNFIFQTGTLSKGFGVFGGIILGENDLIDHICEKSPAFIGSTGLALPLAVAAVASISHLMSNAFLVTDLQEKSRSLKTKLRNMGFDIPETPVPIFSLTFNEEDKNMRFNKKLIENGIYPPFMKYPGSPAGGHFRFVISSSTTDEQMGLLLNTISEIL